MNEKKTINRRQALKTLVAVTGAVSLASLPAWEKPVIEVGALPAHAQNSANATIQVSNSSGSDVSITVYLYRNGNEQDSQDLNPGESHTWSVEPIDAPATNGVACSGYYVDWHCNQPASSPQAMECHYPTAGEEIVYKPFLCGGEE